MEEVVVELPFTSELVECDLRMDVVLPLELEDTVSVEVWRDEFTEEEFLLLRSFDDVICEEFWDWNIDGSAAYPTKIPAEAMPTIMVRTDSRVIALDCRQAVRRCAYIGACLW